MFAYTNEEILDELKKSGEQFADLFVRHNATFIPLIQSGNLPRADSKRFVAQVNDVIIVANYKISTNKWKFCPFVMMNLN